MKYIMIRVGDRDVPIIFPDDLVHERVSRAVLRGVLELGRHGEVVSAGTCDITCTSASGRSTTLELEARPVDAQIINVYDYAHGMELPTNAFTEHHVLLATSRLIHQRCFPSARTGECTGSCGCMGDDPTCPVHGDESQR